MTRGRIIASFIIPTFNSGDYIRRCLKSIKKQRFDKRKFEVLILDGGSRDKTLKIVGEYKRSIPIKVIKNEKVDAESGKYLGIKKSRGEIVILLDSDNEIVQDYWLAMGTEIMEKHKKIWGLESPWIVNKKDPLINQYFAMLKIADPVARILDTRGQLFESHKNYQIFKVTRNDVIVTGANGFFWRRSIIEPHLKKMIKFEEVNFISKITGKHVSYYARLTKYGIYHYYCLSPIKYFSKRVKIANKFTTRKQLKQPTWIDKVTKYKLLYSYLYNFTIIGPFTESVINIVRFRNIAWIYHPIISFITAVIYAYVIIRKSILIR